MGKVLKLLKRIDGRITRSIIKQTVMTTVYGVTIIGARDQILRQLEDVDLDIPLEDLPDTSLILAQITLKAVDGTFKGASQMMGFLRKLANGALKSGVPLSWVTPLGLPVMQPYEELSLHDTKNPLQRIAIGPRLADGKSVSARRHTTAFPPTTCTASTRRTCSSLPSRAVRSVSRLPRCTTRTGRTPQMWMR